MPLAEYLLAGRRSGSPGQDESATQTAVVRADRAGVGGAGDRGEHARNACRIDTQITELQADRRRPSVGRGRCRDRRRSVSIVC